MSTTTPLDCIGVGIDTARYGHRVSFLRPDRKPAAKPLTVMENRAGYQALQERMKQLHEHYPNAHFHVRIDAAGQYAVNLELFLRDLKLPMTISVGEPSATRIIRRRTSPSAPPTTPRARPWPALPSLNNPTPPQPRLSQ
jgi:hypothetical protein